MTAKYYYVPYTTTEDDFSRRHGLIVRASDKRKLLQAIDEEAKEGYVPPELVAAVERDAFGAGVERAGDREYYVVIGDAFTDASEHLTWLLQYGDPRPHPSLESAMEDARSERVDAPHLYRLDARGGLQKIAIGEKSGIADNPSRLKNSHDPVASTQAMFTTLLQAVRSIEDAGRAKRDNDRRAALGTAEWELGQAWTHGSYSSLSAQDQSDARTYLMELGMLVHEWIADDKRPTASQIQEARTGAERLAEFVSGRGRAANPRRARR